MADKFMSINNDDTQNTPSVDNNVVVGTFEPST